MNDNILIAKLRPRQIIELEAYKRIINRKDHTKFSPISTATYHLMHHVKTLSPIYDELLDQLTFHKMGVSKIIPIQENSYY